MNQRLQLKISAVLMMVGAIASAAPLTRTQAVEEAMRFASQNGLEVNREPSRVIARNGAAAGQSSPYYIVNTKNSRGFIIVSGDDRAVPILGYTDAGSYDPDNIPSNMKAWLDFYAEEMAALAKSETTGASAKRNAPARRSIAYSNISPLLKCEWNQGAPYSNMCPVIDNKTCPTGCVATAIAQVMYYHRWPQGATTSIPANQFEYNGTTWVQPELGSTTFDWNNMLDKYGNYNSTQGNAVAKLMLYVGQAIKSGYTPEGTGSGFASAYPALLQYFNYDVGLKRLQRSDYKIDAWESIVYNELKNNRPVPYGGSASGGGHAFVCDGYQRSDNENYFHINWGWGGWCNGYFRLSVLNPDDNTGIGAATSHDGYAMGQDILIGMQPPTGSGESGMEIKLNFTELRNEGSKIVFDMWNSLTGGTYSFDYGVGTVDDNGNVTSIIEQRSVDDLGSYFGYTGISFDLSGKLGAGTYRVTPVSREKNGSKWYPSSMVRYFEVKVDNNGSISMTQHPIFKVASASLSFPGSHKANETQNVQLTVNNGGDEIFTEVFLFASTSSSKGEKLNNTQLVVPENGSATITLYFKPTQNGLYNVWVCKDRDGGNEIASGTVNIGDVTLTADFSVAKFHSDSNFGGKSVGLGEGTYTLTTLKSYGISNDDISSISVTPGYKVIAYKDDNFKGGVRELTEDCVNLGEDWNDKISSLKIVTNGKGGIAGSWKIRNRNSGKYLDTDNNRTDNNTAIIQYDEERDDPSQLWKFIEVESGVYRIACFNNPDRGFDVNDASRDWGTQVKVYDYVGAPQQQFILFDKGDGYYQFVDRNSGNVVEMPQSSTANSEWIKTWGNNGTETQQWSIEANRCPGSAVGTVYVDIDFGGKSADLSEGDYDAARLSRYNFAEKELTSLKLHPGFRMTLYDGDNFTGNSKSYTADASFVGGDWNDKTRSLKIEAFGKSGLDGEWKIRNRNSGMYLDVADNKTDNKTPIMQYNDEGSDPSQSWILTDLGNGVYKICASSCPSRGFEVLDASTDNKAQVRLYDYNGGRHQQFVITDAPDGYYHITDRNSGKAVEIPESSTTLGEWLKIYDHNGTPTQQWQFSLPTGVEETEFSESVILSDGTLRIDGAAGKSVGVYGIDGSVIFSGTVSADSESIPISLAKGIYVVRIGGRSVKIRY